VAQASGAACVRAAGQAGGARAQVPQASSTASPTEGCAGGSVRRHAS